MKLRKPPRIDTAREASLSLVCHASGARNRTKAVSANESKTLIPISFISTRRKKSIAFGNEIAFFSIESLRRPGCIVELTSLMVKRVRAFLDMRRLAAEKTLFRPPSAVLPMDLGSLLFMIPGG